MLGKKQYQEIVTRKVVGERIARLRCSHNLSQESFAALVGVSRNQVCKWESGKDFPSLPRLPLIAEVLCNGSVNYLVLGYECSMHEAMDRIGPHESIICKMRYVFERVWMLGVRVRLVVISLEQKSIPVNY